MGKAKIEELLDNLTLGLKADPEVRLDVKSELRSHLEAKIEEGIQAGLSEEESEKQALKSFGDTIQISDGIADANSSKMSFKARLKVFAGILLIPAVIICALISFDPGSMEMRFNIYPYYGIWDFGESRNRVYCFWEKYTPEEKFILYGDKSRKDEAEQQRAIWERFPENKIYLANYILNLLAWNRNGKRNIFTELKLAEKIDPDNALYNYIAAGLLLEKAYKTESKRIYYSKSGIWKKGYTTKFFTKIKNRQLIDRAVEEYLNGTRKKYFKAYTTEMLQERLNIMGEAHNMVESVRQLRLSASTILPHITHLRSIARDIWAYSELLQEEGKQQEALRIIAPWKEFIRQITEDSDFLIVLLVDAAIVKIGKEKIPEIYRLAGKNNLAKTAEQELTAIAAPVANHKKKRKKLDKKILCKASIFTNRLSVPANFSSNELAIGRKIEYCAIEILGLKILNAFFMLTMLGALVSGFCWEKYSRQKALLLTPSLKLIGKVFLLGIIFPLTSYMLISISGLAGGHEYNLINNAINLGAQFTILLTIIPAMIFMLIRKHIRQRCLELGIVCPEKKKNKVWRIILVFIFLFISILALLPIYPYSLQNLSSIRIYSPLVFLIIISTGGLISYILAVFIKYLINLFSAKKYALYYGALAKNITPIFALAMILISLVIVPLLRWREAELISRDTIIYGQPVFLTPAEQRLTQRLKTAMLKALE